MAKNGNNTKGWRGATSARGGKNITQKLINLHYDYVVYSLTMRPAIGAKDHRARKGRSGEREWKEKVAFLFEGRKIRTRRKKACG